MSKSDVLPARSWPGSIAHAWEHRGQVRLAGRLTDGSSFAAVFDNPPRRWFRRVSGAEIEESGEIWHDFAGNPVQSAQSGDPGANDSGLSAVDELLLYNAVRGAVLFTGSPTSGSRVDHVFRNPFIAPAQHDLTLTWAALDIETDRASRVVAVSLVYGKHEAVFFWGSPDQRVLVERDDRITWCESEAVLLKKLMAAVHSRDPDIITGWNVANFDFAVLEQRCQANNLRFDLGRTRQEATRVRNTPSGLSRVYIPGRQVVDAMRIVRGSGRSFSDMRLETVAREMLGHGKTVSSSGEDKLAELEDLRRYRPVQFCLYCLQDSRLVLDILSESGLDELTLARAGLTGVNLDMAWTSIPLFERIYSLELIRRRVLPLRAASGEDVSGAAGGTVLDPVPGLFRNVLVFDFRSLYPSIMLTFNIDPLAHQQARLSDQSDQVDQCITAPNGARFSRQPGILPQLLDGYFASRRTAIEAGDETAAYVYKILMNSFYGVLGSPGCRYAGSELAGAITSFGKMCLHFARDFFQQHGYSVLYGDTDSVFVYAGGQDWGGAAASDSSFAEEHAQRLNQALDEHINQAWGCNSQIRIRFEKAYRWFLLPRLRSGDVDQGIRGRAKGYAGLPAQSVPIPADQAGSPAEPGDTTRTPHTSTANQAAMPPIDIKGIEAARSDYTPLARRFQTELLYMLFAEADPLSIEDYVRSFIRQLNSGQLDSELVYRKVLRRPAQEYTHAATPQVRAARLLGWTTQRGRIEYTMTLDGPQPIQLSEQKKGLPDYQHYIEHQLRPIWNSIAETVDLGDSLMHIHKTQRPTDNQPHPAAGKLGRLSPLDDQLQLGL